LSWELALAIAMTMTRNGKRVCGEAVLVMFHCLLRTSEMLALRREDRLQP
jgi:hypothetical protein